MNENRELLRRTVNAVLRDTARLPIHVEVAIFDLTAGEWIVGGGPIPVGYSPPGYVLRVGENDHLLEQDAAGRPDTGDLVGMVQDWIIDELHAGWPERVRRDGVFIEILMPTGAGEVATWVGPTGFTVEVGSLSTVDVRLPPAPGG